MASSTIYLKNAKRGQRLTISAIKGAGRSSAAVIVRDDKQVYAELKYVLDYPMGQKTFKYWGNGPLRVELDIVIDDAPAVDKYLCEVTEVKDAEGDVKCTSWIICAEDLEDKNDYTDLVVSVIATDKA